MIQKLRFNIRGAKEQTKNDFIKLDVIRVQAIEYIVLNWMKNSQFFRKHLQFNFVMNNIDAHKVKYNFPICNGTSFNLLALEKYFLLKLC